MVDPRVARALGTLALAGIAALAGKEYAANKERAAARKRAFERFHERIRHKQFGERDLLRERRETLQARLKEALNPKLRPRLFHQGSYALQTGIKPLSGEFDMDLGVVLSCRRSTFSSPIEAKQGLRDVLRQGSRRIRVRRSCVTVEYTDKDFGDYHVDLAVYVQEPDGRCYLAKGKEHSKPEYVEWEPASPEELTRLLNSKFQGSDLAQFRRCIKYLKRWKHVNFTTKAPYSIALSVAAYHWFQPAMTGLWSDVPDDLAALHTTTQNILQAVERGRLRVLLPTAQDTDLMARMTGAQMHAFLERLSQLNQALGRARADADTQAVLEALEAHLGAEFV